MGAGVALYVVVRRWIRRWFEVEDRVLYCYSDQDEEGNKVKRAAVLYQSSVKVRLVATEQTAVLQTVALAVNHLGTSVTEKKMALVRLSCVALVKRTPRREKARKGSASFRAVCWLVAIAVWS